MHISEFAISRRRVPKKQPKQEFDLSERSEFSNSRLFRGTEGSSATRDQQRSGERKGSRSLAASLLVHFLWANKENEHTGKGVIQNLK